MNYRMVSSFPGDDSVPSFSKTAIRYGMKKGNRLEEAKRGVKMRVIEEDDEEGRRKAEKRKNVVSY